MVTLAERVAADPAFERQLAPVQRVALGHYLAGKARAEKAAALLEGMR